MEEVQNLSATNRELGAKAVYGFLTLLLLWSAGDASGEVFWSRQPIVFLLTLLSVGLWCFFCCKPLFQEILRKPTSEEIRKSLSWAALSLVSTSMFAVILIKLLPESPWVSWEFLQSFNVFHAIYGLPFIVMTSFVLEVFLRGYLAKSWGRGNVAFLESITIAVALQHFLPFVLLLPMIFVFEKLNASRSIWIAALTRAIWTLGICIVLSLLA